MGRTEPGSKDARSYVGGRFEIELDSHPCGVLNSVDGGHLKSEAIGELVGGEGLVTRFPGRQKFEDITITAGSGMSPRFWKWIKHSLNNKPVRDNGAIVARDFDGRERSRRSFYDALISEVQFPQLDARGKGAKNVVVKISPERIEYSGKIGEKSKPTEGKAETAQKKHVPMHYAFAIDGFDKMINQRVVKIDAFAVKQQIINNPVGGLNYSLKEAGRIEFPTISVYTPETYAGPWYDWWKKFVGEGQHVAKNERNGSISYTDSSFTKELVRIDLRGIGITSISFDKLDASSDAIRNVKIDLYIESLSLKA